MLKRILAIIFSWLIIQEESSEKHILYRDFMDRLQEILITTFVTIIAFGALFLLGKIIFVPSNTDFCYIEHWTYVKDYSTGEKKITDTEEHVQQNTRPNPNLIIVWELKGHRDFREDRDIGRFHTLEEAIEGARKINCSLEAK